MQVQATNEFCGSEYDCLVIVSSNVEEIVGYPFSDAISSLVKVQTFGVLFSQLTIF